MQQAHASDSPRDGATGSDDAEAPEQARRPPHIDGLPLLGSTIGFVRDGLDFGDRVFDHGDVVSYVAIGERFVAIADPETVEEILVSRSDAFRKGDFETEFGELIAPEGLAFTEGERWRRQRMALQGSFTPAKVQGFADTIVDRANAMADDWAAASGDVHLRDEASRFALDVLARTLLDVDLDGDRGDVVATAVDAISDYAGPSTLAVPEWIPLPAERRYRRAIADLDGLVDELVRERRAKVRTHGEGADDGDVGGGGYGDDLLGTMLASVDGGSDAGIREDELRDQLVTFLFAGHETTATALTYAIWLVAGDQAVGERLRAELDAILDGDDPTFADVPQLSYTEAVVEEALRLYPPVTALYREAKAPTTVGGYRVEPGEILQLATYQVQRDPRWWDAPEAFRPERWLDPEALAGSDDDGAAAGIDEAPVAGVDPAVAAFGRDERPEYAFFPFGGGPRHCIGMRFARLELRLALATLASRLEFEQVGGFDPTIKIALDPGDVRVRAHPRR